MVALNLLPVNGNDKKQPKKQTQSDKDKIAELTRLIDKRLNVNLEKKLQVFRGGTLPITGYITAPNSSGTQDNMVILCSPGSQIVNSNNGGPLIQQGTSRFTRTGDQIRVKRLTMSMQWFCNTYDATWNSQPTPYVIKLVWFYDRTLDNCDGLATGCPTPAANGDFFYSPTGVVGFNYNMSDQLKEINTDRYAVLMTKEFKLGFQSYAGTGALPALQNFANNDFKLLETFEVDLTHLIPQVQRYNGNGSDSTSRGLWCIPILGVPNGTGNNGLAPIGWNMVQKCWYTDA